MYLKIRNFIKLAIKTYNFCSGFSKHIQILLKNNDKNSKIQYINTKKNDFIFSNYETIMVKT